MPNTISVSSAHTDKVVVNGCDLLNRDQLSESQNRELQRYIDENSHLLGFLDKEKEEKEKEEIAPQQNYNSYSLGHNYSASVNDGDFGSGHAGNRNGDGTQSLIFRVNSPASSDYGSLKKKGVSWSDKLDIPSYRARSHSPKRETGNTPYNSTINNYGTNPSDYVTMNTSAASRPYSPAYSTSDKRRTPYSDYDIRNSQNESPWGGTWSQGSRDNIHGDSRWKGFPSKTGDIPQYSSLERHPDDYNRFDTHKYREQQLRRSQDRDESKKFYGYGDHKVSGIEIRPAQWTGGEIITDPNFIKKSIKPRRLFYSPIGDGVVEADGIELKHGPPDLTPRVSVIHERYIEKGDPGRAGKRVYEHVWDEGKGNVDDNDGRKFFNLGSDPLNGDSGDRGGPPKGDDFPYNNGNANNKFPNLNNDDGNYQRSNPIGRFPNLDDNDGLSEPRSGRNSAMSYGTDGLPREGWTKTFITNPRELINQYANETNTNIFDFNDHTPKTLINYKKTITPVEQKDFSIIE